MKIKLAPEWATVGLKKFGENRFGQPNFRVVWGPSVMRIIGGFWEDTATHEYRLRKKYGKQPCWILERWRPAQMYGTPQKWDRQYISPDGFYSVGPYPRHGVYESCEVFQAKDQYGRAVRGWAGFVPLEAGLIELTARAVWMGRINTYSDIRIALRDEELAKERRQDQTFDEMWKERQAEREGLTYGYGKGYINKAAEIEDYARRIQQAQAYIRRENFQKGFNQD